MRVDREQVLAGAVRRSGDLGDDGGTSVGVDGAETQRATEWAQAAPATQPQEETEVSTDTEAGMQPRPATQWMKGAQIAHDLILAEADAGWPADQIAGRWDIALATYDDADATPEQREFRRGAAETAADMIQTLREMELSEAERAQAARDGRETEPEPAPEPEPDSGDGADHEADSGADYEAEAG